MLQTDRFERALAATGVGVGDIDFVMCTHLHVDHVGWNTRLENGRWVPTFPNARYIFADRELAYWEQRRQADAAACPWITDSVLPIVAANRADIVKHDYAFSDIVRLLPTPGHSIDHYSVHVGKSGADAVITGDMIHSPLQARYPELGMMSDYDSRQAGQSRRELFGRFCDTSTLLCTAHFPSPSTGRVVGWRDAFDIVGA
jgi:glyoxylase-like metal-dependent hydrolase (beta-lactamase superfamily II)